MSLILIVLAAAWGGYLVVWWRGLRRSTAGNGNHIQSFSTGMGSLGGSTAGVLSRSGSTASLLPRNSGEAARRRQQILTVLGSLAVVTLLAAFALGAVAILAHVVVDLTLGAYGFAIVQRRNLAAEREIKVRMLYPEGVTALPGMQRQMVNG